MARPPVESATSRVQRLLTMVPWLVSRQGIEIEEAAAGLGISQAQLRADLDLLFLCGAGPMPDELIEASYEGGRVFVENAATIERPLRLTVDEAIALIVGLRSLAATGAGESDAVERALGKLEAAAGAVPGVDRVLVAPEESARDGAILATLREALTGRRRVHLGYHVPSRDERTERNVDPMRLAHVEGHWYLEGWCHRARDVRLFRVDRIEAAHLLEEPAEPPEGVTARDLSAGAYQTGAEDVPVRLRLGPSAHWVAEYYAVTHREAKGDDLLITLPTSHEGLVRRLVLGLGGAAEVLAPQQLRESIAEHAAGALTGYTH